MSNLFDIQTPVKDIGNQGHRALRPLAKCQPKCVSVAHGNWTMSEDNRKGLWPVERLSSGSVEALAERVLSVVASNPPLRSGGFRTDLLEGLVAAVQTFDPAARRSILDQCRAAGLRDAEIIDHYIPAAARDLGEQWCSDTMSFADVTIGVARLQGLARDLRTPPTNLKPGPAVLVVVPQDVYHTLGATVLGDQMRRLGMSVKMAVGFSYDDLQDLFISHEFDAVMVSASASERLETIGNLINTIRTSAYGNPPIVVGGTVLDQRTDVKQLTGADFTADNAEEALRLCGLITQTQDAASPDIRG